MTHDVEKSCELIIDGIMGKLVPVIKEIAEAVSVVGTNQRVFKNHTESQCLWHYLLVLATVDMVAQVAKQAGVHELDGLPPKEWWMRRYKGHRDEVLCDFEDGLPKRAAQMMADMEIGEHGLTEWLAKDSAGR